MGLVGPMLAAMTLAALGTAKTRWRKLFMLLLGVGLCIFGLAMPISAPRRRAHGKSRPPLESGARVAGGSIAADPAVVPGRSRDRHRHRQARPARGRSGGKRQGKS